MSAADPKPEPAPLTLEQVVTEFLELAILEPDKPPKQQYRQRENRAQVVGYCQAQEHLRKILEIHGATVEVRALAAVRNDKQQRPMVGPGGMSMWVM